MREFARTLRRAVELTQAGRLKEAGVALLSGQARAMSQPPPSSDRPSGQLLWRDYAGPAGSRRYLLYVPGAYRGQAMPLLLMLHGCTQQPEDFATGTRMNQLAEERHCLVAYPAQPLNANFQRCWNWFRREDQEAGRGEPAIMAGIVEAIGQDYQIDRQRIFAAGLSAGAAAALVLGQAYPELFAGIGAFAGLPCRAASNAAEALRLMRQGIDPAAVPPGKPMPTIVFQGLADQTVNPSNARAIIAQALGADAAISETIERPDADRPVERRLFRNPSGKLCAELWEIEGLGHAWSGGDPGASHTDANGPDASRAMLRFFLDR